MKKAYIEKNFQQKTLAKIQQANEIIQEYLDENLKLTLRQLYYQFVSRGLIPNTIAEYNKLGVIISDARLAGLIDWYAIEDRTRNLVSNSHWSDPGNIIDACVASFQLDHWKNQSYRVEVWCEKEALIGIFASICQDLDVPYFACKGYVSQSELWAAARRLRSYQRHYQQTPVILHFGDHDPSGIDMTRDIKDRMSLFNCEMLDMQRLALNMDQVEKYNPPPNPAKLTDTRATGYIQNFGDSSWELDALDPKVLRELVKQAVGNYRDPELYQQTLDRQREYIETLENLRDNWETL